MAKVNSKKKKVTTDDLAAMVQNGFLEVDKKIEGIKTEIKKAKDELRYDISDVKAELNRKVHIFDHKDLEYRVEKLEEKVGISRKK